MVPTKVNGFPVLAVMPLGPSRWAVVAEQGHIARLERFVVWSVDVAANGDLHPHNGRYNLSFGRALNVLAERAGYVPADG